MSPAHHVGGRGWASCRWASCSFRKHQRPASPRPTRDRGWCRPVLLRVGDRTFPGHCLLVTSSLGPQAPAGSAAPREPQEANSCWGRGQARGRPGGPALVGQGHCVSSLSVRVFGLRCSSGSSEAGVPSRGVSPVSHPGILVTGSSLDGGPPPPTQVWPAILPLQGLVF